jgi:hypothetical protein
VLALDRATPGGHNLSLVLGTYSFSTARNLISVPAFYF